MSSTQSRFALVALSVLTLASIGAAAGTGDGTSRRRAAGDGRGLTTFGDRGLTTFGGDRFGDGFARRGLTSFSDTPLASMGGLVRGGVPAPDDADGESDGSGRFRRRCRDESFGPAPFRTDDSQASLRVGSAVDLDDDDEDSPLLMPAVELPAIVLDHRPAAALLDALLDDAVRVADENGDLDLARSLDPGRPARN